MVLEAGDLHHKIQMMSKHPGIRVECFEIRPTANIERLESLSRAKSGGS